MAIADVVQGRNRVLAAFLVAVELRGMSDYQNVTRMAAGELAYLFQHTAYVFGLGHVLRAQMLKLVPRIYHETVNPLAEHQRLGRIEDFFVRPLVIVNGHQPPEMVTYPPLRNVSGVTVHA